jgi:hypothetical protein
MMAIDAHRPTPQATTTADLRLKADAPLVRGDGFGLRLLLGYGMTHLDLDAGGQRDTFHLHRFEATLGGAKALAPGRTLRVALGAAYGSDLQASTWRAFQLTSLAMVHWVLGPDDAVILGAVYTSTAEFAPVVPVLGYVHQRDGSRFASICSAPGTSAPNTSCIPASAARSASRSPATPGPCRACSRIR